MTVGTVQPPAAGVREPAVQGDGVVIPRADLLAAWSFLERLVVSLDKFGSEFSTPVGQPLSSERRQQMLEDFSDYFGREMFRDAADARSRLSIHLPDDEEAEAISDSLSFYRSGMKSWLQASTPPSDQPE